MYLYCYRGSIFKDLKGNCSEYLCSCKLLVDVMERIGKKVKLIIYWIDIYEVWRWVYFFI